MVLETVEVGSEEESIKSEDVVNGQFCDPSPPSPPLTHCHGRGFLKNVSLNASRQTCYLKSERCPAHPLTIFPLMLLSLPCLALGTLSLRPMSGKARGPGSGTPGLEELRKKAADEAGRGSQDRRIFAKGKSFLESEPFSHDWCRLIRVRQDLNRNHCIWRHAGNR